MIARLLSFVLILYGVLFALFAVALAKPAAEDSPKTDGIVAITGGKGRIEQAVAALDDGKAERLLIAGADPAVTKADLVRRLGGHKRLFDCCIDLGSESVDTRSNAEEAKRWIDRRQYKSIRLVTSDWHMRRAQFDFRHALGDDLVIVPDAVRTEPNLMTLFAEYNKYLLRRLGVWFDL